MNGCEKKTSFQYEFDRDVPNIIQERFLNQYSEELIGYRWEVTDDQYLVYFDQNHIYKIGSYDRSAKLIQMQTKVSLTGELENVMDSIVVNKGKDYKIESCFWVLEHDSIYYKINYRNLEATQIAYFPANKLPVPY